MTGCRSRSPPARRSASSDRAARANPPSRGSCCGFSTRNRGAVRVGGHDVRSLDPDGAAPADRGRAPGHLPVPRHGRREFAARQARRHPGRTRSRGARRQCARVHPALAAGLRDRDRRARRQSVGRAAPAAGDRPRPAARFADPDPRRGSVLGRCRERGGDPAGDRPPGGRAARP